MSDETTTNVLSIGQKSKRKKKSAGESFKPPKAADLYGDIVDKMFGVGLPDLAPFERKFAAYALDTGDEAEAHLQLIEIVENNVAIKISLQAVTRAISLYCKNLRDPAYRFTPHGITAIAQMWLSLTPLIEEPESFLFLNEGKDSLCFKRIDFDPDVTNRHCPAFDPIIKNMFNRSGILAYFWTLVVRGGSYRQQIGLIKGEGGDGKGALIRFFERLTGSVYTLTKPPAEDNKHFGVDLVRSHIVAFPDIRNMKFLDSEAYLAFTGDDTMQIDPKGKAAYNRRPKGKGVMCTNSAVILSPQESSYRRLVYAEIPPKSAEEKVVRSPRFEDALWAERAQFVGLCKYEFERLGVSVWDELPQSEEAMAKVRSFGVDSIDGRYREFFDTYFSALPEVAGRRFNEYQFVRSSEVEYLLERQWKGHMTPHRAKFKEWLKAVHGIERKRRYNKDSGKSEDEVYYRLGRKNVD